MDGGATIAVPPLVGGVREGAVVDANRDVPVERRVAKSLKLQWWYAASVATIERLGADATHGNGVPGGSCLSKSVFSNSLSPQAIRHSHPPSPSKV